MADIHEVINNLSPEELDLLNSDPKMLSEFKAKYMSPQTMGQAIKGLAGVATRAASPAPAQAIQSALQAPQNVQEGLIRGGATEVGQLTGGPLGAGLGAALGNTAVDLANSPTARQAIPQMATQAATGNPGGAVVTGLQAGAQNPGAIADSLKNSAIQGGAALGVSAVGSGLAGLAKGGKGVFSTVFDNPSLASESVRDSLKAATGNAELAIQRADKATRAITSGELNRMVEMIAGRGKSLVKIGNEAADIAENEGFAKYPTSKLLLYEDAAGKASTATSGGSAVRMQGAVKAIREELQQRAPELDGFLGKRAGAASAYAAEGKAFTGDKVGLNAALNALPSNLVPGIIKGTVGSPLVMRAAGATSRLAVEGAPAASAPVLEALKRLGYLRQQGQ